MKTRWMPLSVLLASAGLAALAGGWPNGTVGLVGLVHGQTMAVNGMVVSPSPMAAQAGLLILQQGGNAFDAAVAAAAVAAVTDTPGNASLGGTGGYATIYDTPRSRSRGFSRKPTPGSKRPGSTALEHSSTRRRDPVRRSNRTTPSTTWWSTRITTW